MATKAFFGLLRAARATTLTDTATRPTNHIHMTTRALSEASAYIARATERDCLLQLQRMRRVGS